MIKPRSDLASSNRIRREGDRVTIHLCSRTDLLAIGLIYLMFVGICGVPAFLPTSPDDRSPDGLWWGLGLFSFSAVTLMAWPTLRNWGKTVIFDSRGVSFQRRGVVLWQFPYEVLSQVQFGLPGFMIVKVRFVAADGELLGVLPLLRERPVYRLIESLVPSGVTFVRETDAKRLRPFWWHLALALVGTLGGIALLVWTFDLSANLNPWAPTPALLGLVALAVGILNIGVSATHRSRRHQAAAEVIVVDRTSLSASMDVLSEGTYAYPVEVTSRPVPRFTAKPILIGAAIGLSLYLVMLLQMLLPYQEPRRIDDMLGIASMMVLVCGAMGALLVFEKTSKYRRLAKGFDTQIVMQGGECFVLSHGQLHRPDQARMIPLGHGKYELMIRFGKDRTYFDPDLLVRKQ